MIKLFIQSPNGYMCEIRNSNYSHSYWQPNNGVERMALITQQEITTRLNYLKKWNRSFKVDKLLRLFYETVTPLKDIHGKIQ